MLKLLGRDEALHRQVVARGAHVLAQGDHVDVGGAHVVQCLLDLVVGFAQADHQAGLGDGARRVALGELQHVQRQLVAGARVAHRVGQALDGFQVLRVGGQAGVQHLGHQLVPALEVGRQGLHRGVGHAAVDGADAGGVVAGAQVGQVVAVDRGQHHIAQIHQRHGVGHVGRLPRVQPALGVAGVDRAELAGARAHRTHQHQGGGAAAPAFGDVGALGFGAHGGQPVRLHDLHHVLVLGAGGQAHAQPRRLGPGVGQVAQGAGLDAVQHGARAVDGDDLAAGHRTWGAGRVAHGASVSRMKRRACPLAGAGPRFYEAGCLHGACPVIRTAASRPDLPPMARVLQTREHRAHVPQGPPQRCAKRLPERAGWVQNTV